MTRWLVAFWIATVLLCTGMTVPGTASAAPSPGGAWSFAPAAAVPHAGETDQAPADGQDLPATDSEQPEQPSPENAWDGAELLGVHPAAQATATRSLGPPGFSQVCLPQPYIEGPQRPPRAAGRTD